VCIDTPREGGIIVFLQSYGYKEIFMDKIRKSAEKYTQISECRKIFEENKET
jgi:hypothetical protein